MAVVALAATFTPVVRSADDFPLSNYPMFIINRPDLTTFDVAVGVDSGGNQIRLSPALVAGSIEVIQAVATVEDAVNKNTTADLCGRIAARVALASDLTDIEAVAVITETYDIVPALSDNAPPVGAVEHTRCPVRR